MDIEIRVLIRDQGEGVSIQIVSGTNILTDEYFKKREDMDIKTYVRKTAGNSFYHALLFCLDHWEFKTLGQLKEGD